MKNNIVFSVISLFLFSLVSSVLAIDISVGHELSTNWAKTTCAQVCKNHGGWSGNWSNVFYKNAVCGCNGTEREKCLEREGDSIRAVMECNKYSN